MRRFSIVTVVLGLAIVVSLLPSGAVGQPSSAQRVARMYFVPLGEFPSGSVEHLATYYKHKLGLTIEILPALPLERSVVDDGRQQLIADEMIALMKREYHELASDPKVILTNIMGSNLYS